MWTSNSCNCHPGRRLQAAIASRERVWHGHHQEPGCRTYVTVQGRVRHRQRCRNSKESLQPGENRPDREGALRMRWAWNSKEVTTPKFPPPPRSAQNRSSFSEALAVNTFPSAVTICEDNKLSMDIPYFRMSQPTPPPSVRPPIPVLGTMPHGTASPNTCVSLSMSPRVAPPCT